MIGFGELRRLSLAWHTDISAVERSYALDWLLSGLFETARLGPALVLRDATALSKVFFLDYPQPEEGDLSLLAIGEEIPLESELVQAAQLAAARSGMQFRLESASPHAARFEYTGPLGRRSAAQPHLTVRFFPAEPHAPVVEAPMLHPFSDSIEVKVRTASLEELAAARLALLGAHPRARDVYDLWFILTRGADRLDAAAVRRLVAESAQEKGRIAEPRLDPDYLPLLAKVWDKALNKVPGHPTFDRALADIRAQVGLFFFA